MRCILVLCLSGSVLEILYFSLGYALAGKISADWKYRMMKGVILFYLVPLPFLKWFYKEVIDLVFCRQPALKWAVHYYTDKSLIIYSDGRFLFNQAFREQYKTTGIWIMIAMVIMTWQCMRYLYNKVRMERFGRQLLKREDDGQIEQIRRQYSILNKVKCLVCREDYAAGNIVFTTGIVRPVIFISARIQGREREMILNHEMVHIKRRDVLWRVLVTAVQVVHWYNPIVWLLPGEFERICEMSCDERVLQGRSDEEKKEYLKMLFTMAVDEKEEKPYILGLSKGGKRLKERMDNVMKDKKRCFGKIASACIVGAAMFLNTLTVFAYEDMQFAKVPRENEGQLDMMLQGDFAFISSVRNETVQDYLFEDQIMSMCVVYEMQFVDREGIVYPVNDEISSHALCNHIYVVGEVHHHKKNSDGSCIMVIYDAKRCTKCNGTQIGEEKGRLSYKVCPH
ncbi:MAG: M56 family metallopeptidase [Lachnospiraceae bacterium]|nr:M56 family metallopeptidase [Lachnospiraceae bacterium]MDE7008525.1 M56 family metallopeptidase [Lachnospiraceae bacterium]